MKVLLIPWMFYIGGVETHIMALARHLRRLNHDVAILYHGMTTRPWRRQYLDYFNHIGVHMLDGRLDDAKLYHLGMASEFDVVNTHSSRMAPLGLRLGRDKKKPVVATIHGPSSLRLLDLSRHHPDHLVSVSKEVASAARKRTDLPVTVIENGVDLDRFEFDLGETVLTVTYVGRADQYKTDGIRALIQAVNELGTRYKVNFNLLSQARLSDNPDCSRVTVDTAQTLQQSHVVVGTGRAIMEGMACGCVPISLGRYYDGTVRPDTVERLAYYNFSGRYSRRRPDSDLLFRDLLAVAQDRARCERWQRWAATYATQHFDAAEKAEAMLAVYHKVLR